MQKSVGHNGNLSECRGSLGWQMFSALVIATTVSPRNTLGGLEFGPVGAKSSGFGFVPSRDKNLGFGFVPVRDKSSSFEFVPVRDKNLSFGFVPGRDKNLSFEFGSGRAKNSTCAVPPRTTPYSPFLTHHLCKAISAPFKGPLNPFPFMDNVFPCHGRIRLLLLQLTTIDETYGWNYVCRKTTINVQPSGNCTEHQQV